MVRRGLRALLRTLLCAVLCAVSPVAVSCQAVPRASALGASFSFYEAQRSGRLLRTNRVAWRGDSLTDDRTPSGKCVVGGYYDAGDNVKFLLPFGWTFTVLAWSLDAFADGYRSAGQTLAVREALRWAADFSMSCYESETSVVAGVGDGDADHAQWRRPEDVPGRSAVYMLGPEKPGSDVAGALASSLAATSHAFRAVDARFSNRTLAYALALYEFGAKYRGRYSDAYPDQAKFYKSSSYHDELAWAAAWLWRRTDRAEYRAKAEEHLRDYVREVGVPWNNFDWDSAYWGVLSALGNDEFRPNISAFVNAWKRGVDGVTHTPQGLAWSFEWGSLRHNGNAQFYALANDPSRETACWAKAQQDLVLGGAGRSYVVGVGPNPPCRPHHRGASCRDRSCSWNDFNSPDCNPHIILGALVGGPGKDGSYVDARSDFQRNEVALDYNAGWTAALAAVEALRPACGPDWRAAARKFGFSW